MRKPTSDRLNCGITGVYPVMISLLGEEAIVGRRLTDSFRLILDHGMRVIVEQ
jgi:hypothetical protein